MAARLGSAGSKTVASESFTATEPNSTKKPKAASSRRPRDFSNWAWRSRSGCDTRTKARLGDSATAGSRSLLPGKASGEGGSGLWGDASFMQWPLHSTNDPLRGADRDGARQRHGWRQGRTGATQCRGYHRRRRWRSGRDMQRRCDPWWRRRWRGSRYGCRGRGCAQAWRGVGLCLPGWRRLCPRWCSRGRRRDRAWDHQRFRHQKWHVRRTEK